MTRVCPFSEKKGDRVSGGRGFHLSRKANFAVREIDPSVLADSSPFKGAIGLSIYDEVKKRITLNEGKEI